MRRFATIAVLLVVSACSAAPPWAILNGATVVGTEKTLEDHAVSLVTGKSCSTVRVEKGLPYCEEDEIIPRADIYCYRTLGEITCYDRPDPHQSGQRKVGDNEHNLVKQRR